MGNGIGEKGKWDKVKGKGEKGIGKKGKGERV